MNFLVYILAFLAIPLSVGIFFKFFLKQTYTWKEFGLNVAIIFVLCSVVYGVGSYNAFQDTEIWNGKVISKHREHGHYEESYDCMCSTTCTNGTCTESCSTCYRDHYTVDWYAKTTVGNVKFKHLDRTSKSVYREPDPKVFVECKPGEPASKEFSYTNYLKATPDSLFNTQMSGQVYADKIPAYPSVHSFYKINRVISVDSKVPADKLKQLNTLLNESLIFLGATKQVNAVVIVTEIDDPTYRHAVENSWLGGKKNDVVLFFGMDGEKVTWVDVMTWALNSGNELFHVTLRDELAKLDTLDPIAIDNAFHDNVVSLYDRPQMKDYEYLKEEIDPPFAVLVICWIISILGTAGLTYYFHKNNVL